MKKLLITGGSGYVGSRLIEKLLKETDLEIVNYDISLFGDNHLPQSKKFKYYKEDITNPEKFKKALIENNIDTVLHLACISNDPTYELDPKLSKKINYDCFEDLVKISKLNNVKKFIYASTCSVYGISDSPDVFETNELKPITDYNKYKALCEPILQNYLDDNFVGIIIRPATVCGFSEKMRFDLTVNILTNYAYNKGYIRVFGGKQSRPNIHIDDMCSLYKMLILNDITKYNGEIFNAGTENLKILENFIFSSTMETYGFQPISDEIKELGYCKKHAPFDEKTEQNPNAPYAIAKLGCEYYLKYAGRAYNFPYTILRQTNTYGRTDNDFFVVEQIIIQMLKGDLCKLGYKTPYRNFIHIDDLLDLYEVVLKNSDKAKKEIFCIGPNNALRIDELAEKISNKLNWNGKIEWGTKPARPGEIYYLNSTNDHVKNVLGWEPKIDLDTGLDKTIKALKKRENL